MLQSHYTQGAEENYKEMRRGEKRIQKKKKREFHKDQEKEIENLHGQKESRRMYRLVNYTRKEYKLYTFACRDNNGLILIDSLQIMEI